MLGSRRSTRKLRKNIVRRHAGTVRGPACCQEKCEVGSLVEILPEGVNGLEGEPDWEELGQLAYSVRTLKRSMADQKPAASSESDEYCNNAWS